MTLSRLVLAWLPVALWFLVVGWAVNRWIPLLSRLEGGIVWTVSEALLVTLFGSLWFDSLGHGGWWLLFGLVGLLAAGLPARPGFRALAISVLRYVGAGALLAWRLA